MLSGQRRPICQQEAPLLSWPFAVQVAQMSQEVRDAVGTLLLQLTLKELFQWRFMQTDPNWGNFLFDGNTGILHLIDFGEPPEITAWARVYGNEYSITAFLDVLCHDAITVQSGSGAKQSTEVCKLLALLMMKQALNGCQKGKSACITRQLVCRCGAGLSAPVRG